MGTIEERALYLSRIFGATKANKESAVYRACIRMAEEQREIDLRNAMAYTCKRCDCSVNGASEGYISCAIHAAPVETCMVIKNLIKTMNEL